MVLLKTQLRGVGVERLDQQRSHITHGLFALAETNKIQNLGRIGERVLNFLREVRVAVLTNGYMFNIGNLRANCIQARSDRERRESAEVFMAVQPLLSNGELHFTIENERRGGIGVKHVEAQDEHELTLSPLKVQV